jgi:hypothetical protein
MSYCFLLISVFFLANITDSAVAAPFPVQNDPLNAPRLDPDQLDNLIAPVALFPDPVLRVVLTGSAHPDQLGEAQSSIHAHANGLSNGSNWDDSVRGLATFPNVVGLLSQDPTWTSQLGVAYGSQPDDVMDAVQRMRARARAMGWLSSSAEQTVTGPNDAIQIQPADPRVIYIPVYDPQSVWGRPALGNYPRLFYPGESYAGIGPGLRFLPGVEVGDASPRAGASFQ